MTMDKIVSKSDYGDIPAIRAMYDSSRKKVILKIGYESDENVMGSYTMSDKTEVGLSKFKKLLKEMDKPEKKNEDGYYEYYKFKFELGGVKVTKHHLNDEFMVYVLKRSRYIPSPPPCNCSEGYEYYYYSEPEYDDHTVVMTPQKLRIFLNDVIEMVDGWKQ